MEDTLHYNCSQSSLITEGFEPEHGFSNRLKHNLVSIIEGALKSRFERIGLL
jgi:hypothetical protein